MNENSTKIPVEKLTPVDVGVFRRQGGLKLLSVCFGIFLTLCCSFVSAQQVKITGTVSDNNETLTGVTVKVKGTVIAVTTDVNGKYTILAPGPQSVLVFSFIGYIPKEVTVGAQRLIDVTLLSSQSQLNEVVVIGYGTVRKPDATGSVAVVRMNEINKAPVTSIDQALAGRIAGVQVTSPDGQPGSAPDITVRGTGSITNSSAPLYVVDGFPQEGNPFSFLNAQDVESVTVLKDASSTAIYGARGSNGVVVITTKRGNEGTPKINYNAFYGVQSIAKQTAVMSPYDFVRLQLDINPQNANALYLGNGRSLDFYRTAPYINWQDKVFQDAPFMNHSISVAGKSGKTNYYLSGSYVDQKGLMVASGFNRYQGRISLDQEVVKNFKIGITANYGYTKSYGNIPSTQSQGISGAPGTQNNPQFNLMFGIWGFRPVNGGDLSVLENTLYDAEGSTGASGVLDRMNPYILAINTLNNTINTNLNTNTYAEFTFLKKFVLRSTAGINITTNYNEFFNNSQTRAGSPLTSQGNQNGLSGGISNSNNPSFLNENTITYNTTIRKIHHINALVGFTDQTTSSRSNSLNAIKVPNEALGVSGIDEGVLNGIGVNTSTNTQVAFLGRINYDYKSKYLLTASMRADGSSKFYTGNKWGYFPTAALAWKISEEPFMQKLTALNNTKLRVSYGLTGNNRVGDFAYTSPIAVSNANSASIRYSYGNTIVSGAIPTAIFNPDLKWETGAQLDVGFETGILKDRFNVELDYYRRRTGNLLLQANLPNSIGYSSEITNVGDIQNEGIEVSLSSTNIRTKNFMWTSNFNISFNRNKVLSLSQGGITRLDASASQTFGSDYQNQPSYIAKVGQPVALIYGYVADGLYRLADFDKITNGTSITYRLKPGIPYYGGNPATVQPGDLKVKDLNNDGVTNDQDYATIGNPMPIHYGGFSNNFTYKGFDLNVFMQWSYGNQILNGNKALFDGGTTGDTRNMNQNFFAEYADYWTPANDGAQYQRPLANATNVRTISSRLVEDGSYLRLKTIQVGYNFPKVILNKIKISNLRIFASGQNLYTWTNYSGQDPEVSTKSSPTTPGFDYSPYPRARVFVFGANITL
ncbi:TonB-dependent receptor [Mucilaginibacter sp. HMF5004]|uniref:SusC/RagA family TonB-linked outer membrane protein n=1 Tax=Mucilaginibacter rivuli TaxID=2857527 RepID=UPI001C5F7570|nr:TonB-dependent receptor [Mucilaginibacter rivuli]MBW4889739.1 TonB-dependent receptor [Mucilaginibacter rivuli]